jgi:hypothetical protein
MLAASDFSSTVVVLVAVLAAGAWLGFWWCRKNAK